ncbi:MAG TPA: acetate--CoA ligase family protein, partial [bacterium]|nr:acetate--CoA ligase family protein [bacterium]
MSGAESVVDIFNGLKNKGAVVAPEPVVKGWLRARGVAVPDGILATSPDEAAEFAAGAGGPVVMKLVSDRVLHKTELGGVRLGVKGADEARVVFAQIRAASEAGSDTGFAGVLVEKQEESGIEIIIGLQNDPHFGPAIMLGVGGIFTDLFKDVVFRALPATREDIESMISELKGRPLLEGFRGAPRANIEALVETAVALAKFGEEFAPIFESVDFNPVIVTPSGATVVDAKLVLAAGVKDDPLGFEQSRINHLDGFFNPASVAVVGASASEGKIGNVIVDSLVNYEFKGKIYPINPNREEILGVKCWPSLGSLPEAPELVVMVVDLKLVPGLMKEIAAMGSHNMLIVSGGGKELGGERESVEKEIVALSRQLDIRVVGPNCIGAFDGESRFDSFFHHQERLLRPPAGPMSFITQSGTWGCGFLELAETVGVSKMVSYGNRVDVDEGDLTAYLARDARTKVIASYIEGLAKGRKFLTAAHEAVVEYDKPVVVFKTGRNATSAKASVSHTGAYGGSYKVYEGLLKQAGIVAVDSFHELYAASKALALQPPAAGPRAAMLSNGAGPMVNALDLFPAKGLELVRLERSSVSLMRDHFSFFYIVENPVDVTGSASAADYEFVIRALMDDDNVDIIMPFFVFQDTPLDESIVERMEALNRESRKPILGCAAGGPYTARMSAALERVGVPVLPDVAQWTAAASALVAEGLDTASLD